MSLITRGLGQQQLIITAGLGGGEVLVGTPLGCVFVKQAEPLEVVNDTNGVRIINDGLLFVENDQTVSVKTTSVAVVQRCDC